MWERKGGRSSKKRKSLLKLAKIQPDTIWKKTKRFRKEHGLTKSVHRNRILNFFKRRDDRTYIVIQSVTVAILFACRGQRVNRKALEAMRLYLMIEIFNHGQDRFTERWKSMINKIQNSIFESILDTPRIEDFNHEEQRLFDMIVACSGFIKDAFTTNSLSSDDQLWAVAHICQTRFFPPPGFHSVREKVVGYIKGLIGTTDKGPDVEPLGRVLGFEIMQASKKIGKRLYEQSHISLSSGSCWEASRRELGKWHVMLPSSDFIEFLNKNVNEIFESYEGWYRDHLGNKVCEDGHGTLPIWKVAYLKVPLEFKTLGEKYDIGNDLRSNFRAGFDARFGQLLFSWSAYKKSLFDQEDRPLKAKLIVINEPGGKIRPLTSGETWAYIYMVPAMHMLSDAIQSLPGARVGLADSDNLYRAGQSYGRHSEQRKSPSPEYISSSDLTSATDRASWKTSRTLMRGMIYETTEGGLASYLCDAVDLCCSQREVFYKTTKREAKRLRSAMEGNQVDTVDRHTTVFKTKTGIMMGDPITKVILTASSMAAWYASRQGFDDADLVSYNEYRRRKNVKAWNRKKQGLPDLAGTFFSCAGDDHIVIGSASLCKRVPKVLQSMAFEISWPKYRISKKFVHYCQDFGVAPRTDPYLKKDTLRLRLLNQFRKGGSHANFEHPDTLIGKGKMLEKFEGYLTEKRVVLNFFREIVPDALRACMPSFAEEKVMKDHLTYAPTYLGGLGIPSHVVWQDGKFVPEVARAMHLQRLGWHQQPKGPDQVWHRGMLIPVVYEKEIVKDGLQVQEYSSVWSQTKSAYTDEHTIPSNRFVSKKIRKEMVNVSEPSIIEGVKDASYAAVFAGAEREPVRRRKRARHILLQNRRYARSKLKGDMHVPFNFDFEQFRYYVSGTWVSREDFQIYLGVPFVSTKTWLSKHFMSGEAGLFDNQVYSFEDEHFDLFEIAELYSDDHKSGSQSI